MFCNDTASLLGKPVTTGRWDDRYDRDCTAQHRKVKRAVRQQERRLLADEIASLADPTDEWVEQQDERLRRISDEIMATNDIFAEWDAAARAEWAAEERAREILAYESYALTDPATNDRCHDRNLPGWRGHSRYGVSA